MQPNTRSEHTCPLCGHTATTANDVYVHLQLNHRKSEICSSLIAMADDEDDRTEGPQQEQIPSSDD